MNKKTPTSHTDEELLQTLEHPSNTVQDNEMINYMALGEVAAFLSRFKIEQGKDAVSKRLLLELYRSWTKEPMTKLQFELEIAKYLMIHQKGSQTFYLINQKAMTLSQEAYKFLEKKTRDKTKSPNWRLHFENFLSKYDLKPGNYFLESFVLYNLYDKYVYEIGKKMPLGENQFYNFCNLYFTNKRLTDNRVSWFGVDESIKNAISEESINTLRESRPKRGKKTKQKN